ncbi:hypothetical protein QCA50_002937 [Cerrena zonata]|uniref:Citrate synthase n=1 Tax=Cerrena zonata TaxID=2478898 RepID=A0AAW0GV55_9APHY
MKNALADPVAWHKHSSHNHPRLPFRDAYVSNLSGYPPRPVIPSTSLPRIYPTPNIPTMLRTPRFAAHSVSRVIFTQRRLASTKTLKQVLDEVIPPKQAQLKKLKAEHGQAVIGDIKVEHVIGGMRGLKSMLWEASVLDPIEGIRFHGLTIPDCQKALPAAPGGKEIIAESMLWLLLTGKIPTEAETRQLSRELADKGELPSHVEKLLDSLPQTLHPMTQLGMGVAALNHDSAFAAAYEKGIKKAEYWTVCS